MDATKDTIGYFDTRKHAVYLHAPACPVMATITARNRVPLNAEDIDLNDFAVRQIKVHRCPCLAVKS